MDKKIKLRDEEVQQILQKTFPGKTIIAIDALAINFGGGGIHCITINEPKAK
jgi:agmatine deiminase